MMVIFLTGLVSMILMRTLRNDYAKYAREDDDLESLVINLILISFLYAYIRPFLCCSSHYSLMIFLVNGDIHL